MSKSCEACVYIDQIVPETQADTGITPEMLQSLRNGTGLKPGRGQKNYDDLMNLNDCIIGGLIDVVNATDSCDWREILNTYISQAHGMFQALIAAEQSGGGGGEGAVSSVNGMVGDVVVNANNINYSTGTTLKRAIDSKQNQLIAGENITIEDDVISASGSGGLPPGGNDGDILVRSGTDSSQWEIKETLSNQDIDDIFK